jgi:thymidylate synthase
MSKHPEYQYLDLLSKLLEVGDYRRDRTGVGTKAIFGHQMRFDLAQGFPVFGTKKVLYRLAWVEIIWMLSGSTSLRDLLRQKVRIWSDWPLKKYREATGEQISQEEFERRILGDDSFDAAWGDLGPVYGKQWRRWRTADGREIDQVQQVVDLLKNNPTSRRILWDGWNVGELDQMALPPCHKHYQFFVRDGRLDGAVVQRSADAFLGLPFNVCNLALLTHMLAEQTGLQPGEIVWFGLDTHLYSNHEEAAKTQLQREPRPFPKLIIKLRPTSLFAYTADDFELQGYDPHPSIKADVAV